jgi:hypothetical protein
MLLGMTVQNTNLDKMNEGKTPYNSTYKKLAIRWLNKTLCFVSSSVVADSFRLRNRQLLVAANRYASPHKMIVLTLNEQTNEK